MFLYLVRHGVTAWNREGRFQGHTDVPLSEAGIEQACRLADRLAHVPVDAVWSSDMARARETAEIIAARHGLDVTVTPLLRETMLGDWEGLTEADILARGDSELLASYRRDSTTHRPPGGETLQAVWDRLLRVRDSACGSCLEGTVVVVGHGGSLRAILCSAIDAPIESMRRVALDNASVSLVEYSGDRTWLRLLNDTGHLRGH